MTTIFSDPSEFADDQLTGFVALYADRLRAVHGGVVALPSGEPIVAVVVGGGSGHYPAFAGLVGPGFASGAVVGNIFTSPSASQIYSVARAADRGRGVILTFGNYAGDVMNFGIAAERLRREGIDTRIVVVTDDVASASDPRQRRGIAGDFAVFKALGAAAADGLDIDQVERVGRAANDATRTLGVAFSGCRLPGADDALFSVPDGMLGLGLGIHGEPGIRDVPMPSAPDLAELLVRGVLDNAPRTGGGRVGVILNGLGTTKYEELFLLWGLVAPLLAEHGLEPVDAEVGELVTSLDMGGCSLTLTWLDDELERYWRADAYAPAYRKLAAPIAALDASAAGLDVEASAVAAVPDATPAARGLAAAVLTGFERVADLLHEKEAELGAIDAVAGDGDHGRGMVKGIDAATAAAAAASAADAGAGHLLSAAGQAWAARAGGTSGVLWGAALEAAGRSLGDDADAYTAADAVRAVEAFAEAIVDLGRASIGDKTLVDALLPFRDDLAASVGTGRPLGDAWAAAARLAASRAAATRDLTPRLGRARPLAEKSVGTPDAGATSMGMILLAVSSLLDDQHSGKDHK
ncbi:D-erythrulose 4-kinase [Leifsonia lichenia]